MEALLTLQVLVLLLGTAIALLLTLHAWQRRPATGSIPFSLLMLAVTIWSLTCILEFTNANIEQKLFWARMQYMGIVFVPAAWLWFVWEYTDRQEWITWRNILAISAVPFVTLLLVFTNDSHHLLWQQVSIIEGPVATYLSVRYGTWFWVHTAFAYIYLLVGSALLIVHWVQHDTPLYRGQTVALLIGLLLPWIGNLLYILRISFMDLTPFAFTLTGLLFVRHTLRFRLFDISPIAHRTVVNSMQDGVLVLDRQQRIVEANAALQDILLPQPVLIGQPVAKVWPELARCLNQACSNNFEVPVLDPAQAPDVPPAYFEVTVSHLYDWRHTTQGQLLLIHDITNRKQEERARLDMTRSMVHDLRAPISNSLFALEMLQGELVQVVSSDDKMLLEMTVTNTRKTLHLVNQILNVNRLENGRMPVSYARFSLPVLIEQGVATQRLRLEEKKLQIVQDLPADLPSVWGDPELLERVLQNLLDNSIKFSPVAGTITITAHLQEEGEVWLSVRDEGPGIPPELQATVFEKYVTGTAAESGSGLGLSFCQMAVRAHGQDIWLESPAGHGATFTFSLATTRENEEIR